MRGVNKMKSRKHSIWLKKCLVVILLVSQLSVAGGVLAEENEGITDLIIYQNIPQVEAQFKEHGIQLSALHLYADGHFTKASEGLRWTSSNRNVATVDSTGQVTFTGQNGRTFITVTNDVYSDRIALDFKVDPQGKKKGDRGKPPGKMAIVKEKGERYDVISKALAALSLEEKIGQMMMPDFRRYNGQDVTNLLPEIEELVQRYHLGGVILFRENVVTTEQTAKLVYDYQQATEKFGLLLTIDQEGGIVTRLQSGTDFPGNMALGATRSADLAHLVGKAIGEELQSLGINTNLAPVLDVNNNPDNPVIGVRSIAENPELVAELGTAYIEGLQSAGVAATAKHFPGHGDTDVDSHLGLPEVPHDRERLEEIELYPFQQAMRQGVDAIMTAHVTFPKIDNTKVISRLDGQEIAIPATLSYIVLTELMREEMGFEGVIITDAMNMQAITDHFGPVDAALRAVQAGADIILMPVGLESVFEGLKQAVEEGTISTERIDASVERILTLKVKRGIIKEEHPRPVYEVIEEARQTVGSAEHKALEAEVAARSITLVKNENAALPLHLEEDKKVVVVGSDYIDLLHQAVKQHHDNTVLVKVGTNFTLTEEQQEEIRTADTVLVGSLTASVSARQPSHPQMSMIKDIAATIDVPLIVLGIRNPYDIMAFNEEVQGYLVQYSFRQASFEAVAAVLFGEIEPAGKIPVTIPSYDMDILYPYGHGLDY